MKDMTMAWITQKHAALGPRFPLLRIKRHLAPPCHEAADVQTPMGFQIVHDPVLMRQWWQALIHMLEMRDKVRRLPRGPQGPGHVARGHGQRVDQHPGATAAGRVFTSLSLARWPPCGARCRLQPSPPAFSIGGEY